MGRQVDFYMAGCDEQEFMEFLKSDRDVAVLAHTVHSAELVALPTLPGREEPGWFLLWLWDRTNSPQPELRAVPEQKHYVVDSLRAEVVEFSRSYLADDGLVRGRIWAEMDYWDLGQNPPKRIAKGESFLKWFDRLAGWIKRKGRKNTSGEYVLVGAASYEAAGGRLCQVHMARNVKQVQH